MPQVFAEFIAQVSAQVFIGSFALYFIADRHFSKSRG